MKKYGVLLIQLGSPKSPEVKDVKAYLHEFLTDKRLIPQYNKLWWKLLLNFIILPTRSPKSAHAYQSIWKDGQSPLITHTENFCEKVKNYSDLPVEFAFAIGQGPRTSVAIQKLLDQGCTDIRVIPLFPQFASATTLSAEDAVRKGFDVLGTKLPYEIVPHFYQSLAYIDGIRRETQKVLDEKKPQKLLISFHSYPVKRIHEGDPYYKHCIQTAELLAPLLTGIDVKDILICFQSKLGRAQWLEPATQATVEKLGDDGLKNIAVVCPAFTVDNLETLEEIDIGLREIFIEKGGEEFTTVPCLNDNEQWCQEFSRDIIKPYREIQRLPVKEVPNLVIPQLPAKPTKISKEAKSTFKIMALILFLDSAGFSVIFPLFPHMLEYYLGLSQTSDVFSFFLSIIKQIESLANISQPFATVVLFGGLMSFLYGGLQFLASPLIGAFSDKYGRRPVLLFCLTGIAFSYLLWGFAGSFGVLVLARILAGVMGSSITTASAVVADLTDSSNRSKGMAILGASFGMGFVFGPILGGLSSLIPLDQIFPSLTQITDSIGLNPFSGPAFLAFFMSMTALHFLFYHFKETYKPGISTTESRSINILKLFSTSQYPNVTRINLTNFFFLAAFSGAEFALTFLTTERLGFSPTQNGLIFLYLGFLLIMVQGGYVRRKAGMVGEHKLVVKGLWALIPSMILVAFASNIWILLIGLALMAFGSSILSPCLSTLCSRYAPSHEQGRILGTFRSLGSLGRCIGPLIGCLFYWKFGATATYSFVAVALFIPLLLIHNLSQEKK